MTKIRSLNLTKSKLLMVVLASTFLSGCSISGPVVVITPKGQTLRGNYESDLQGGSFMATDGKLTCSGNYDSLNTSETISMQVLCSDGRKGFVTATRENDGRSGHGTVHLNDGSTADFVFGRAAQNF